MEKRGSQDLQCVGKLKIARPRPAGFLCGSIPVTTDEVQEFKSVALVPSTHTVRAPRYRMIPRETDLNSLPLLSSIPEKVLPIAPAPSRTSEDAQWRGGSIMSSLTRKGEALAVSGLTEYGDDIDVIAPADILKQIFKIPYSKARVSIAVHRVGQTLILNTGPDIEEGENLIRRHNGQPKKCSSDQSLFLNFAMHSVRMEACDCPPSHNTSSNEQFSSSIFRGEGYGNHQELPHVEKETIFSGKKNKNKGHKDRETVKKVSEVKEKSRYPVQESQKYRQVGVDEFLRVLFWQFHNFRMLLGSDLLIFSNEKYVAVSLHLWDVSRKVTPLVWLEAWLDNFMASVPELAICYHQDGVVQGYELLKTDDIFLLKGISEDGTPAFHPQVVQQNGHSVMRFLQENCTQDPGAYWLYKSAGEDVIQLFDLSVIPKNQSAESCHDSSDSLPSFIYSGRSDSILALGTLLYRIAHRLSLSMYPNDRARCARFFKKCLDFLDEPNHLVVRALAHEQFARLLLTCNEDSELTSEVFPVVSEVTIADTEEESFEFINGLSPSRDIIYPPPAIEVEKSKNELNLENFVQENSVQKKISSSGLSEELGGSDDAIETVSNPLLSKLGAIHHVSQAIKSLRYTRKLQTTQPELNLETEIEIDSDSIDLSVCACGDSDCIEVCDIREWLPTSKIDDKLLKLVLLLGESYLALAQAYKDDSQPYQALKVIELACLIYGSMPQDEGFISSMVNTDKFSLTSKNLFWAKAWTLVGDVFIEFYSIKGQDLSRRSDGNNNDLKMSSKVLKEVDRLKKKMAQFNKNCSSCSLINCSCRSDRASSGSSASSSSTRNAHMRGGTRKKSSGRNSQYSRNTGFRETDDTISETCRKEEKSGGIFKYLRGSITGDVNYALSVTLTCYEEARKAMEGLSISSEMMQSLIKKKGWVYNELGRIRLERKDVGPAESAFSDAIEAFRLVQDHTNIILINCNLGHGRRALAEDMASKIEFLKKKHQNAYLQMFETAKLQYREALRYYAAAKTEVNFLVEKSGPGESSHLKNEVYTQYAHTSLKLGMLLARESTNDEISANDAIREALSVYESLGEWRKQEAAYTYFQLACHQRDCCLRFLESDRNNNFGIGENGLVQKVKQYALLAERNWLKSMDFYGPRTHPLMYLTILMDMSDLSFRLSSYLHSIMLLESSVTRLLEAHHLSENTSLKDQYPDSCAKFWSHLQMILKSMLSLARSTKVNKSSLNSQHSPSSKSTDARKLSELYKMSLKSTEFSQCPIMHRLWTS